MTGSFCSSFYDLVIVDSRWQTNVDLPTNKLFARKRVAKVSVTLAASPGPSTPVHIPALAVTTLARLQPCIRSSQCF